MENLPVLTCAATWRPKWPAQPTGLALLTSPLGAPPSSTSASRQRRVDARAPDAPPPASTSCCPLIALDSLRDATRPPTLSHSLVLSHPCSSAFSPHGRACPPPPTCTTAATAIPEPPRAILELRHLAPYLLTEPHDRKGPEAPPRCFSPPRPPEIRLAAPLAPMLPRARRSPRRNRRELLLLLPLSAPSLARRSCRTTSNRTRRRPHSSPVMLR